MAANYKTLTCFIALIFTSAAFAEERYKHFYPSDFNVMEAQELLVSDQGVVISYASRDSTGDRLLGILSNDDPMVVTHVETQTGKTLWKTTFMDIGELRDGRENLFDLNEGYLVAGQGSHDTQASLLILLDKNNGRTKWKTWLEKDLFDAPLKTHLALDDYDATHVLVQSFAQGAPGELWVLGYVQSLQKAGGKFEPDEKETAKNLITSFLVKLNAGTGEVDSESLKFYGQKNEGVKLVDMVLSGESFFAVGERWRVENGVYVSRTGRRPIVVKFDLEFNPIKQDEIRIKTGYFQNIVAGKTPGTLYVAGTVDDRFMIARYDEEVLQVWSRTMQTNDMGGRLLKADASGNGVFFSSNYESSTVRRLAPDGLESVVIDIESQPGFEEAAAKHFSYSQQCEIGAATLSYGADIRNFVVDQRGEFIFAGKMLGTRSCPNKFFPHDLVSSQQSANWFTLKGPYVEQPQPPTPVEKHPFDGGLTHIKSYPIFRESDGRQFEVRETEDGYQYAKDQTNGNIYKKHLTDKSWAIIVRGYVR